MDEDAANAEPVLGFDLETYAASYSGHTRIDRCSYIASRAASANNTVLELQALKIAYDNLKKGSNTLKFQEVALRINGRLGGQYLVDTAWIEATNRRAEQKQDRLESELHGYKTNLIKESIRMGHQDLGDFLYERGDLQNAFKCYVRTRDYCTTPKHMVTMCLAIIRTSLELGNLLHLQNYIAKAEQTPDVGSDVLTMAKLNAAAGLHLLASQKYKMAARRFCEVSPELGSHFSDVISMADVATYGALCALATYDRADLKTKLVSSIGFRELMEAAPEVRDVVNSFYGSQYLVCLRALEHLRPALLLDMHLADHVPALLESIRKRALAQYCTPFTSINMHSMAAAFDTNVNDLEREVAALIMDGHITARIDSGAKVVYARHADARAATYARVLAVGEEYARDSQALLLRAALLQHDFMQKPKKAAGGAGGVMGPPSGGMGGSLRGLAGRDYGFDAMGERGWASMARMGQMLER